MTLPKRSIVVRNRPRFLEDLRDLETSEDKLLRFSSRYGLLICTSLNPPLPKYDPKDESDPDDISEAEMYFGEEGFANTAWSVLVSLLVRRIKEFQLVYETLLALRRKSSGGMEFLQENLKRYLDVTKVAWPVPTNFGTEYRHSNIGDNDQNPGLPHPVDAASEWVSMILQLRSPAIVSHITVVSWDGLATRVPVRSNTSLLEEAYVMLIDLLAKNPFTGLCRECNRPFPARRSTKQYCSPECSSRKRQREFRDRGKDHVGK